MKCYAYCPQVGVLLFSIYMFQSPAIGHPGHGHGTASSPKHSGAGIASIKTDDSLKASVDVYGYLAGSAASRFGTGQPLGAGGKIPLYYNQWLYRENPYDRAELTKKDYWPQYRDFSYNPLWQPSQFGTRAQYRFFPGLWATASLNYFGSLDKVTAEPNPLEVTELFFRWAPAPLPGFSLSLGHLALAGTYAPGFDQFPLENFQFNGVSFAYDRDLKSWDFRTQAAVGRSPIGRLTRVEPSIWTETTNYSFLDGTRERTHFYATTTLGKGGFSFGLLGGVQVLPEDSTVNSAGWYIDTVTWPQMTGWQAGAEAGFVCGAFEQHATVSYGYGDVEMAWGSPDLVYRENIGPSKKTHFLREGSSLTQAVYWGGFQGRRFGLSGGAWAQWRRPDLQGKMWEIWKSTSDTSGYTDSVFAETKPFRSSKFYLEPVLKAGSASLGVRMDGILYFDKQATTNTVERMTDQALRAIQITDPVSGEVVDTLQGASLWDREAADTWMLSPFVELDVGNVFHMRAAWSGAWYSAPVRRQGESTDFHANTTLSAWLTYRFGFADEGF